MAKTYHNASRLASGSQKDEMGCAVATGFKLERISGPARFVLKRRERPRSRRHRQLVDARCRKRRSKRREKTLAI